MLERSQPNIDAANDAAGNGALLARGLAGFFCDVLRAAASSGERDVRRVLRSPYARVARADSGALEALAGPRGSVADAAVRERTPLSHAAQIAARAALRALADVREAYRAQGATASETFGTIVRAFSLDSAASEREVSTLGALAGVARSVDERVAPGTAVEAAAFAAAIEDAARREPPPIAAYDAPPAGEPPHAPAKRREAPRNVRRRKAYFSASSLGAFAECERKWYYRYVCAAVEDKGSSASYYGSAFHWALEKFHQDVTRADAEPQDALEAKLDAWVATAFERYRSGFTTNVEYQLQVRRARRTAKKYIAWFVARHRARPFEVIGTESSAELEIDGYSFIGYIDRLDRDLGTGNVTVIDYKTGSIAESAARYREGVASLTDFQLPFYYWARSAAGDRVARLALVPLKDATLDVRPIELEVVPVAQPPERYSDAPLGTIGVVELERARRRMAELARRLSDEPIENFAVASDPDACTFCAYRNACRERPLQLENRFGR